jgi:PAS domain S-box-containing protein
MSNSPVPSVPNAHELLLQGVMDYAIYMLDPQGRVVSWNPGAELIKGYTQAEIVGHHFSRFYTEEDRAAGLPAEALRIAAEKGRFATEGWRQRKDGARFWAAVVIDPIRQHGTLVGFAKITRDLTERRETQLQLEQSREQLFQSQKMEAVGQLTGGLAHDLPGGMSGRQLAEAVRLQRPGLKVLFITGYAEVAVTGSAILEPGTYLLTKPFAIDALAARITSILTEG